MYQLGAMCRTSYRHQCYYGKVNIANARINSLAQDEKLPPFDNPFMYVSVHCGKLVRLGGVTNHYKNSKCNTRLQAVKGFDGFLKDLNDSV